MICLFTQQFFRIGELSLDESVVVAVRDDPEFWISNRKEIESRNGDLGEVCL